MALLNSLVDTGLLNYAMKLMTSMFLIGDPYISTDPNIFTDSITHLKLLEILMTYTIIVELVLTCWTPATVNIPVA